MVALALVVLLVCLMLTGSVPISEWSWDSVPGNDLFAFTLIIGTIIYLLLRRD